MAICCLLRLSHLELLKKEASQWKRSQSVPILLGRIANMSPEKWNFFIKIWFTLVDELVSFLKSIKSTPSLSHKEDKNIFPPRLTRCWIFLRVPTTFPCHSDKMLCPTLLVYPLLFPPLPWSTSGGPAACFTDVSSTQLLSCFSNGFLQQMIPCVYAPSFLLTPFLSIKTICCCFRSRETPSHTTDAVFFRLWHWYTWSAGNTSLLSVPHD